MIDLEKMKVIGSSITQKIEWIDILLQIKYLGNIIIHMYILIHHLTHKVIIISDGIELFVTK